MAGQRPDTVLSPEKFSVSVGIPACAAPGKERMWEDKDMTRSNAREIAIQLIFSLGFGNDGAEELLDKQLTRERFAELEGEMPLYGQFPNEKQLQYIKELVQGVFSHGPELDDYISRYAVGWTFARIPRMASAIMRTAMYEVLYMPDIPNAAAINEAVEIAKNYEPQEVVSFVNGILGTFVRTEFSDTPPKPEKQEAPDSAGEEMPGENSVRPEEAED